MTPKEAIKRLRSIGEKGMRESAYREVNDSLALYRQDLELVLSVHNDIDRYFELLNKLYFHGETFTIDNDVEFVKLTRKLRKVGMEE